ncbi:MAG: DUF4861 domain-containing protein [Prolixibacteraceae bacterium]|nr:DUF4861 domain-containing protein [Prolixibacteraceae bacterium]
MKTLLKISSLMIAMLLLTCCNPKNNNTLVVEFNENVPDQRVFEFHDIENHAVLKEALTNPFLIKQGEKEIPSQVIFNPANKTHSLLIYPIAENKTEITFNAGTEVSQSEYTQLADAELWVKTGGEFVDGIYEGGDGFTEVDSLRVPDVCTDHSLYIKYEGPGWESNLVGYRFYLDWRNAVDIYGKKTNDMVLEDVGQDGYESYHEMQDWGMDVLKVGTSLGIGSIGYWNGEAAERVAKTDSVICKVLSNGPLRSMIETSYYGWETADFKSNCTSYISIDANSRLSKQRLIFDEAPANVCTGIHLDETCEVIKIEKENWVALATWGKQSLNNDNLGLVVFAPAESFERFETDVENEVVVLKPENNEVAWYFGACWELEPDGITTLDAFKAYIDEQLELLNNPDVEI